MRKRNNKKLQQHGKTGRKKIAPQLQPTNHIHHHIDDSDITIGAIKRWLEIYIDSGYELTTVFTTSGSYEISELQKLQQWNDDNCLLSELGELLHD